MLSRSHAVYPYLAILCLLLILNACGSSSDDDDDNVFPDSLGTGNGYTLLAWNDLGMHCVDGRDYSVFSILPPYNNLHAQLNYNGSLVESGVTLTYESLADDSGSINTTSVGKTNFWDYAEQLYGIQPAADTGLTGNMTPSTIPRAMQYNGSEGWFEAEGIPIMPIDDAGEDNHYPMVRVTASDSSGTVLATADVVLPVSSEMSCVSCHGSGSGNAAMPDAGWVEDADAEKDWKKNILRLHDEKQRNNSTFVDALASNGFLATGLEATSESGQPILCASCHSSNALPGTGISGIPALTRVLHDSHADAINPDTGLTLNDANDRAACYLCHPGSVTQCLRGAMGNARDENDNPSMSCQSCHGNMQQVGSPAREGWLDEPDCQSCHHDGKRLSSAVTSSGALVTTDDTRFATNPDTPAAGYSLYRFSTGHGGLQCEACHGATHAIYPSALESDNKLAESIQGHAGTIAKCSACHQDGVPRTSDEGPHGMHTTGAYWVNRHEDVAEDDPSSCTACHGDDYRGSPLAIIREDVTFSIEDGNKSYSAGDQVTCYDCHNGPH